MRLMRPLAVGVTLFVGWVLVLADPVPAAREDMSTPGPGLTPTAAEVVLNKAWTTLGGSTAFNSVTTFEIRAVEERDIADGTAKGHVALDNTPESLGFTMRWPDQFQIRRGHFVHTLDGPGFWMQQTGGPTVPDSPALQETARRSTQLNTAYFSLMFLLKSPPALGWHPRFLGELRFGDLTGPTVAFEDQNGKGPKMVFRTSDCLPVALVTTALRVDATGGQSLVQVLKVLEDYRSVGRLRFPFRLEVSTPGGHVVTEVESIRVNERLSTGAFAKPRR